MFETVWFRGAGLALGSSFSASSIVLASFMAGLALGNALAARRGPRLARPWRLYAAAEAIVALTGVAIAILLPQLGSTLGRLFTPLLPHPWLTNLLRFAVAFSLMIVPATAMGVTLPILAKALTARDDNFGQVLGRLYGWNTLGGMMGALASELLLVGSLGQRGTALAAGALNLAAAGLALFVARRADGPITPLPAGDGARIASARSWRLLGGASLAGAILLGLEVVWFRFLQLFVFATSFIFAAMLATVLLGIGAGGLIAAWWLGRDPRAHRFTFLMALAAGVTTELSYALFDPAVGGAVFLTDNVAGAASLFLRLMLPTCVLSGVLFTFLGAAYREQCGGAAQAAGGLTVANTLGAMVGALLSGFVLLPHLGMEKALFVMMLSYAGVAGLTWSPSASPSPSIATLGRRWVPISVFVLFAVATAFYPFGLLRGRFLPLVIGRYKQGDPQLLAVREGLTETAMLLRTAFRDQPLHHRLMTNGHSMSATTYRGRRYMKLYAYWALAINPDARNALLISYGVGTTAKALVDTRQLRSIDVVDISPEILALGPLVFPGGQPPLADARVRVHVEDGRFFLQTTDQSFDVITAEPPPPRGANISNLYSREYFQLVHDRLREGGVATYWLPVNQLWLSETKAIMRGFCDAFPDCTLWSGAGLQWMLAGTRGAHGPIPEEKFTAQWRDPLVAPELAALGFEQPEALGATFIADATTLDEWTRGSPPLDDDHPGRMALRYPADERGDPIYRAWMQPAALRQRFEASAFIRQLWPRELRARTADSFAPEAVFDDLAAWGRFNPLESLHGVLTLSSLRTLPLLLMGTEPAIQSIALPLYDEGQRGADLELEVGAHDMAQRNYAESAQHFARVTGGPRELQAQLLKTLALHLAGRSGEAGASLTSLSAAPLSAKEAQSFRWLSQLIGTRPE